jgi:hypothetical protein
MYAMRELLAVVSRIITPALAAELVASTFVTWATIEPLPLSVV